jgi:DNA-3-methyladenine glycosylase I
VSATPRRCPWARSPLDIAYHDTEWGVPVHDDRVFFEFLILEGAQAGLSWSTILNKRDGYRRAFAGFDPAKVARFTPATIDRLVQDAGIVRHRQKIESAVTNAKAFLRVQAEHGSFERYVWPFVGGAPKVNRWQSPSQVPARTPESDALSKDLKRRGFSFVGSTICYALMQATGMVNDHLVSCFRDAKATRSASPRRAAPAAGAASRAPRTPRPRRRTSPAS